MNDLNIAERQAEVALALQREIAPKIAEYKALQEKLDAEWDKVETIMLNNNLKQIKGEWGVLTIGERLNWSVDMEQLPAKFRKVVADTTKISNEFRLYNKAPKGCAPSYTKYLTKRLKGTE